jgi:hypothetical protein
MKKRVLLVNVLAGCLGATALLAAPEHTLPDYTKFGLATGQLQGDMAHLCGGLDKNAEGTDSLTAARADAGTVSNLLDQAVRNPNEEEQYLKSVTWDFYFDQATEKMNPEMRGAEAADEAFRVSLLQARQNRRIIELLEQVVKQRAGAKP